MSLLNNNKELDLEISDQLNRRVCDRHTFYENAFAGIDELPS